MSKNYDFTAKGKHLETDKWVIGNVIYRQGQAYIYNSETDETVPVDNRTVCMYSGMEASEGDDTSIFMNDILKLTTSLIDEGKDKDAYVDETVLVKSVDNQPFFVTINIFHSKVREQVICPLAWIETRLQAFGFNLKAIEVSGNLYDTAFPYNIESPH